MLNRHHANYIESQANFEVDAKVETNCGKKHHKHYMIRFSFDKCGIKT
jgi:hypothetical protein